MARPGFRSRMLLLTAAGLLAAGCYTFRGTAADKTVWDQLPNDPRPELWIEGSPRLACVFDGVSSGMADQGTAFDAQSTRYYRNLFVRSHIFTELLDPGSTAGQAGCRIRIERVIQELSNTAVNLTQAVTMPGLLGYRFGLVATHTLTLERPGEAPAVYEARSALTQIYHHSSHTDAARAYAYREVDRANTEAILHQLRADPALFDAVVPPQEEGSQVSGAEPL